MTAKQIRRSFLEYFAQRGHTIVPSSSLVPADDPTLLFTNAGMNQFKDLFLGKEKRAYRRAASSQKCMRVSGKHNDLDTVGPSLRHHTFFEMLGNFSFGDYFKQDAIPFAWELLTKVWGLDEARLFPSVFKGDGHIPRDEESFGIWQRFVPAARIAELGIDDNFWSMGDTGPCGRCSEIYFFRGHDVPCSEPVCRTLECSCDRYIEIWNNVFMEFDRQPDGTLTSLPALCVDTGMGLERITSVIQGQLATYDTDLFSPILAAIGRAAGRQYTAAPGPLDHPDVSMRVIADHLRAMTFIIGDGVLPQNEGRGYVLRKIMRRAMRHGKKLGFTEPVLHTFVSVVVDEMGEAYPELVAGRQSIARTVRSEEDRFDAVLTSGLPRLEELIERTLKAGAFLLPTDDVFKLYDSFGIPLDFIQDVAGQRGVGVDPNAFEQLMQGQRDRARASAKFGADEGSQNQHQGQDRFVGYEHTLVPDAQVVMAAGPAGGQDLEVWLDQTPFYVESGGQVSDVGELTNAAGLRARVVGVRKGPAGHMRAHKVHVLSGHLKTGDRVTAHVDEYTRNATRRNHTATHLLHAALRQRLGSHVHQKGSLVAPDRLRFDFTHDAPLSPEERRDIERIVNEQIFRNTPVVTEEQNTADAMKAGAMALFGEKYGDRVRVVTVGDFSMELCGGTHVRATGDIGPFVITEESGVAAGVRRLEALTGEGAIAHIQAQAAALDRLVHAIGTPADRAVDAIAKLQADARRLARDNEQLKMKLALGGGGTGGGQAGDEVAIGDATLVARRVSGLEKGALRTLSDSLRDRIKRGVVVLVGDADGKVQLVASVSKDLTDRIKAGQLVKELAPIVGGSGGGRPDFAEAGGKDASRIDALLAAARESVAKALA
ncbi:MAG TPA: alanine--tRNA ligase [Vicinamibacterales bacterium]|nr:alanine--tRNA ligase [Vicinamibacterales bacterium]